MSAETPETRKAWDDCKHNDFPHIAGVMFEKSQSLERRNSELTARIAELERQVACVNHYIPLAIRDSEAFVKMEAALAEARKDSAWQPIKAMSMQSKTDEELNVMLAGICFPQFPVIKIGSGELRHQYADGRTGPAFAYCSDLNAVATVEAGLTDEQREPYVRVLQSLHNTSKSTWWDVATATARQRTIALIETLQP